MSVSRANITRRLPPPWLWTPFRDPRWQALLTLALALAAMGGVWILSPSTARFMAQMLSTWAHESGHYLLGEMTGKAHGITINPNGSGHTGVSSGSPVLVAAAGPLLPAWGAALLIGLGATRLGNAMILAVMATVIGLTAYLHVADPQVAMALWAWVGLMTAIALAPSPPILRSAAVLVVGLVLMLGTLNGLPTLMVSHIDGDLTRPSDTQVIADVWTLPLKDVANGLKLLMLAGFGLAAIYTLNWFARHCR